MGAFTVATISAGGYGGIALLMAIESACLPLPSELIMPFVGYLVSTGRFSLFWVATAGALGCNLGSTVAWFVGDLGGRPLAEKLGKYVLIDSGELDRIDRFFARYGSITVLVARLLPGIRSFIALPAGIAHMRQLSFQLYTFIGSWPWCYALAYIGEKLGDRWNSDPQLHTVMQRFEGVLVLLLVAALISYVVWRLRGRRATSR